MYYVFNVIGLYLLSTHLFSPFSLLYRIHKKLLIQPWIRLACPWIRLPPPAFLISAISTYFLISDLFSTSIDLFMFLFCFFVYSRISSVDILVNDNDILYFFKVK